MVSPEISPPSPTLPNGSRTGEKTFFVAGVARSGCAAARRLRVSVGVLFADPAVDFTLAFAGVTPEATRAVAEGPEGLCSIRARVTPGRDAMDGPAVDSTRCDMGPGGVRLDFAMVDAVFDAASDFIFL